MNATWGHVAPNSGRIWTLKPVQYPNIKDEAEDKVPAKGSGMPTEKVKLVTLQSWKMLLSLRFPGAAVGGWTAGIQFQLR